MYRTFRPETDSQICNLCKSYIPYNQPECIRCNHIKSQFVTYDRIVKVCLVVNIICVFVCGLIMIISKSKPRYLLIIFTANNAIIVWCFFYYLCKPKIISNMINQASIRGSMTLIWKLYLLLWKQYMCDNVNLVTKCFDMC